MVVNLVKQFVGSANDRYLKKLTKDVKEINALEPSIEILSDEELKARTETFRQQITDGSTLDLSLIHI